MTQPIPTSDLLESIANDAINDMHSDRISIGEFVDKLADRGFGLVILLCAIPNLIPVNLPGVSTIFSIIIATIVIQWMIGKEHPWLPEFIRKRSFDEKQFARGLLMITPKIRKMERVIKPRGDFLLHHAGIIVAGICILIQCCILVLPLPMIPFSNSIPAFFICLMAIGILARDGYVMLGAMLTGTAAIYFLALTLITVLSEMWDWISGYF